MTTHTDQAMPLVMLGAGRSARVVEVRGGKDVNGRLASLGVLPGATVSAIRTSAGGPVILSARESRVAIGRGMAQKVMVEPIR